MIKHANGPGQGFAAQAHGNQKPAFVGNKSSKTFEAVTSSTPEAGTGTSTDPSFQISLSKEAQETLQGEQEQQSIGPGKSGQSPAHLARQYWSPESGVPFGHYVSQIAKDRSWVPPELLAEEEPPIVDGEGELVGDEVVPAAAPADDAANDGTAETGGEGDATDDTTVTAATVPVDDGTDDGSDGEEADVTTILEAALDEPPAAADPEETLLEELLDSAASDEPEDQTDTAAG